MTDLLPTTTQYVRYLTSYFHGLGVCDVANYIHLVNYSPGGVAELRTRSEVCYG